MWNLNVDRRRKEIKEMESMEKADQSHGMEDQSLDQDQTEIPTKQGVLFAERMVIGRENAHRIGIIREGRMSLQA